MMARAERQRLNTAILRKESLALHLDNADREPTPYISFRSDPVVLEKHVQMRFERMGPQEVTAIDPAVRLRKGVSTLSVATEMRHYGIQNPYSQDYHSDHYVCLWVLDHEEIIWHGRWKDVFWCENWYEDLIMQMGREFGRTAERQEYP
jgi:hypothetical protein